MCAEMVGANSRKRDIILNVANGLDESGTLGHGFDIVAAEVVDMVTERISRGGTFGQDASFGKGSQRLEQEVTRVEARGSNYTIYKGK